MKRFNVLFIVFIFTSLVLRAQQISFGVKGGLSLVDVSVPDLPGPSIESPFKTRPSYHFGFYGQLDLGTKTYLQPELLYSNKGTREGGANIHLHYLTLPVLFNYRVFENIHAGLGGEIGYKLASRAKSDGNSNSVGRLFKNK